MPVTAHPASQRAIDPAALPMGLRAMRLGFRVLRRVHRRGAARLAARLFVQPRHHGRPHGEVAVLEGAERLTVTHKDKAIAAWCWSAAAAAPARGTALLVHGWEGRGSQLGAFVEPLRAAGYRVVTFDHVGHGDSDGRACSLPTMRDTLRSVAAALLPDPTGGPELVVAHSMGSFAVTLLLADGWPRTRAVYLSPPDDLLVYFGRYLELVTASDDLLPDLIALMEERFGERVEEFAFRRLVTSLHQELLVIHSRDDLDVPVEAGRFVAEHWPGARIEEVDGLGHRRILRDRGVVARVGAFAAAEPANGAGGLV